MMFKKSKATLALLVDLHEELVRKLDEQIRVEKEFIGTLSNFLFSEQKLDAERLKYELLDAAGKKAFENDRRF
jgi:hypothetical protein